MTDLSKPEFAGEWIDVGPDDALTRPAEREDGTLGSYWSHRKPDGKNDALGRIVFGPGHHELISIEPLTIGGSLLCLGETCRRHGFVRDGKWVNA